MLTFMGQRVPLYEFPGSHVEPLFHAQHIVGGKDQMKVGAARGKTGNLWMTGKSDPANTCGSYAPLAAVLEECRLHQLLEASLPFNSSYP
jgi:hypothetical protein